MKLRLIFSAFALVSGASIAFGDPGFCQVRGKDPALLPYWKSACADFSDRDRCKGEDACEWVPRRKPTAPSCIGEDPSYDPYCKPIEYEISCNEHCIWVR